MEGSSSGATGFLRYDVNTGTTATVYDVRGQFSVGERITFDGSDSTNRSIIGVKNYETSDVQSIYGIVGSVGTFTADLIPTEILVLVLPLLLGEMRILESQQSPIHHFLSLVL